MKATLETLKIVLVFAVKHERQQNMFTGRSQLIQTPQGTLHICELEKGKDGLMEPSRFMMCGKTRSDIGEQTKDSDKRPLGLPMCLECETRWKTHPDSPWRKWYKRENP